MGCRLSYFIFFSTTESDDFMSTLLSFAGQAVLLVLLCLTVLVVVAATLDIINLWTYHTDEENHDNVQ